MSDNKMKLFEKAEEEMKNQGELVKHADKTRFFEKDDIEALEKRYTAAHRAEEIMGSKKVNEVLDEAPDDKKDDILRALREKKQKKKMNKKVSISQARKGKHEVKKAEEVEVKGKGAEYVSGVEGERSVRHAGEQDVKLKPAKIYSKEEIEAYKKKKGMNKADEYERKEKEKKKKKDPNDQTIEDKGDTPKEKGKRLSSASSEIFKSEFEDKENLVKALAEAGYRESALLLQNWNQIDDNAKSLIKSKVRRAYKEMKPDKMNLQEKWNKDFSHVADEGVKAASKKKIANVERSKK